MYWKTIAQTLLHNIHNFICSTNLQIINKTQNWNQHKHKMIKHQFTYRFKNYHHLFFLDLGLFDSRKKPHKPHVATLGEGGSFDGGETLTVRYGRAPADLLLSNVALDPTAFLSSSCCCWFWLRPDRNLSSQTNPDEPCLLNDANDFCNSAMFLSLTLSLSIYDMVELVFNGKF